MICAIIAAAVLEGPFPLLVTPWTEQAKLDVPVLVKEAEFVDRCEVGGIIWPTAGEVATLDAADEYEAGLRALAERSARPGAQFNARITAICCGKDTPSTLARVRKVQSIYQDTQAKMAILARPADNCTNQAMIAAHYRALAKETTLPVIIQTYNGKSPQPDVETIAELSRENPEVFGWVKEESPGLQVNARMEQLLAKPEIHAVFSGWGAKGFVYQGSRIGTCGCISQRPAYAGLFTRVWRRLKAGANASDPELAEAFSKYLYMTNLGDVFAKEGDDCMRGPHLYVLERLGIFRNRLTRSGAAPGKFKVTEFPMSDKEKAEVDARLAYVGVTFENPLGK